MPTRNPTNRLRVPSSVLNETFVELRQCGAGKRECQVLWTGAWASPNDVTSVVHPVHRAHGAGFELDSAWLTHFWRSLVDSKSGIRAQIHTHPGKAFHSATDDEWPIIHSTGFLSLVIPHFAKGEIGFKGAYLARLEESGAWRKVEIAEHIEVIS